MSDQECSSHPCAPHGFCRNQSHTEDRYVCECEGWTPPRECRGLQLQEEINRLRSALEAIARHQRLVAGTLGGFSVTLHIAENALGKEKS